MSTTAFEPHSTSMPPILETTPLPARGLASPERQSITGERGDASVRHHDAQQWADGVPEATVERQGGAWQMLLLAVVATILMALPAVACAQTDIFNLPVVDEIVCGFVSYARSKLAPMLAVGVVILAIIGHWLGVAKMWSQVLYVGIGLGVIMGVATAFARYGSMGSTCIS